VPITVSTTPKQLTISALEEEQNGLTIKRFFNKIAFPAIFLLQFLEK
jgi:hypothetical protein